MKRVLWVVVLLVAATGCEVGKLVEPQPAAEQRHCGQMELITITVNGRPATAPLCTGPRWVGNPDSVPLVRP